MTSFAVPDKFVFLHTPRCAGSFFSRNVEQQVPIVRFGQHARFGQIPADFQGLPVISIFREPVDWLESVFNFWEQNGWNESDTLAKSSRAETVDQFAVNVLTHHPDFQEWYRSGYWSPSDVLIDYRNLCQETAAVLAVYGLRLISTEVVNHAAHASRISDAVAVMFNRNAVATRTEQRPLKVLAFMYAYNEADIISWSVRHAVEQGLSIHVTDNWSNDGTFEILERMAKSDARITVSRWPEAGPTERVSWHEMLQRVELLALESGADWCVHYDADEIRRSQVAGERLIDAIARFNKRGFNAIDHRVELYAPRAEYNGTQNPETYLNEIVPGSHMDQANGQVKCWKQTPGIRVDLASSGGHRVQFSLLRMSKEKLLLKHYPLRSPEQEVAKLKSRRERWAASDRAMDWHVQYEKVSK